ncbi:MAG: transcriptional regulator of Crp family [Candidatus Scalindua rubra]|uniref:Transcriptional regulator of Crp family n=1 Tax=Candidatus Scalindua rubra TaxID=1872076 RepID=A0A1E3X9B8_9BACT|nr:MAG: transcriptional regulator of Crp family [Candidatus Scalindua rubra]
METKTIGKGDVIIQKGSHETRAYIIESGRVEVSDIVNNKKTVLAILGEKQIFGEMGLVEDKPRSATVTAIEDTRLAMISRDNFNELFEKNPKVLLPIIKALFERLRTVNKMLISKETPDVVETIKYEGIRDAGFVVLSGLNEISSEALNGGEMKINNFPFKVGREHKSGGLDVLSDNDLYLEDSPPFNVSRNHFLIDKVEGKYVIVDRGSRLGTIVNGEEIDEQFVLNEKMCEIIVGKQASPFAFKLEIR